MGTFDAAALHHHGALAQAPVPASRSWQTRYLGYAGIWYRVGAYVIDVILIFILVVMVMRLLEELAPQVLVWWLTRSGFLDHVSLQDVVIFLYFFGLEITGATPGKRLLRLRVIRADGEPMTVWASLLRNILRPIDLMVFGAVGVLFMSTSEHRQRLGDRVARTIVVQLPPK